MDRFSVKVSNDNYKHYYIDNKQEYKPTEFTVPGDISSAAILFAAGALAGDHLPERDLSSTPSRCKDNRYT